MKHIFKKLGLIGATTQKKYTHEDIVFVGLLSLCVLCIAIIIVDGYVLYATLLPPRADALPATKRIYPEKELDTLIRTLDTRAQEFERM